MVGNVERATKILMSVNRNECLPIHLPQGSDWIIDSFTLQSEKRKRDPDYAFGGKDMAKMLILIQDILRTDTSSTSAAMMKSAELGSEGSSYLEFAKLFKSKYLTETAFKDSNEMRGENSLGPPTDIGQVQNDSL